MACVAGKPQVLKGATPNAVPFFVVCRLERVVEGRLVHVSEVSIQSVTAVWLVADRRAATLLELFRGSTFTKNLENVKICGQLLAFGRSLR